ncbi:hypothetical protein AN1V17_39470 [Vallitalea sediminicola]
MNELDRNRVTSKVFYKERWIKENGLEQKLIVTFSLKYRDYQKSIRNTQIERAVKKQIPILLKSTQDYNPNPLLCKDILYQPIPP